MEAIVIFSNALVRKPYFQCSSRLSCEPCLHHFSDVSSRPPPRRSFLAPGRAKSRPRGAQVPKQGSRGPPKGPQNGTKIVTFRPGGSRPFFANCVFHVGVPPGPQKPQKNTFLGHFARTIFDCDSDARRQRNWPERALHSKIFNCDSDVITHCHHNCLRKWSGPRQSPEPPFILKF